jgi:putative transposase
MNSARPAMPKLVSSFALADILGIADRSVRRRAEREGWPWVHKRVRGGLCRLYPVSPLPADVLTALARWAMAAPAGTGAAAGRQRGCRIVAETEAAAEARRQAREQGLEAFRRLPEERRREAEARFEILKARDAFIQAAVLAKKKGSKIFCREFMAGAIDLPDWVIDAAGRRAGRLSLSYSSLNRWEQSYATAGLAGLAGGYSASRGTTIAEHMQTFIVGMLVAHPDADISDIIDGLAARFAGMDQPSTSAVRRFVARWREEHRELYAAHCNPDDAKNRYMPAFGQADEPVIRLNQLWEFDSTPADVMLADGRHSLIGVIDVYSRRLKLLVSPTSKATAVAALIRRTILDWGVPEVAKTDNGADYVSDHIQRVFDALEILQVLCPPFTPEEKPHIERAFKTVLHGIFKLLPGFIGHNVAERQAIRSRRSFANRMMDKDSDPVQIRMTSTELQALLDRWTEAVYHHDAHSSLNGSTPTQVTRAWLDPVRRILNEHALDILLAPAPSDGGRRTVRKKGIRVDNAWHIAPELGPMVGQTVYVLLDATDYGTIHVFRPRDDSRFGEFVCRAFDPLRTGHDRADIAAKAKETYTRVMADGRKQLKKIAREVAVKNIHEEILGYREAQLANVVEMPRPSESYTTDALEQAGRAVDDIRRSELGTVPIEITTDEEKKSNEVIRLADKQSDRQLPASPWEKYEVLTQDLAAGKDLDDAELAWMKRYELYLETGKMADGGLS